MENPLKQDPFSVCICVYFLFQLQATEYPPQNAHLRELPVSVGRKVTEGLLGQVILGVLLGHTTDLASGTAPPGPCLSYPIDSSVL